MVDSEVQEETKKPYISNCVTFNGTIISEPVSVGDNFCAFKIKGKQNENFPLIIVESELEIAKTNLKPNQNISAFGFLQDIDNEWVIMCKQITIGE